MQNQNEKDNLLKLSPAIEVTDVETQKKVDEQTVEKETTCPENIEE